MNGIPLATIIGLLLAMGGTTLFAFLKNRGCRQVAMQPTVHLTATWGCCLALLCLVLLWEGRPLSSIGISGGNYLAWAIGAIMGVTLLVTSICSLLLGKGKIPEGSLEGVQRLGSLPWGFRVAIVLTAGITEEIAFRGYPIERLNEITGNLWLAAALPLAIFTLAHLSGWSLGHLVGVFFGGALLTILYLWQRDLIACMIAHALIDSLIIGMPFLLKKLNSRTDGLQGVHNS